MAENTNQPIEAEPTPAPTPKNPLTASVRFKNQATADRFFAVFNARKRKNKSATVSDFITQMFEYVEPNPYGDFYTGK